MFKLKYLLPLLLFIYINLGAGLKHPLHVSTTEVSFNAKEKSLEVSCRIFTDDFESILVKLYKQKTDLSEPAMKAKMDEIVKKYLMSHLQIKVNGKPTVLKYIGFEIDHEATNIYLEVDKASSFKAAEVTSTILYDQFDDQMSIVHLVNGKVRKSSKILFPDKTFATNF
ncbi:hypothetical protein EV200_103506 [Pedobacter psychrotolerans]|uniref:Uncharacterized protein n=1 Tax=Pedobacter psychrotolerans TaxID=1843235 RepID=A0A4R2HF90_9SPHI|nr:DUF6702 family protein [Pedobacter psychrotolerans]TCO27172.1 hypothetical protein EV200_103506 [Pedobacter psychrotolerans]GGE59463.1 hypothetical protein GCM10011413_27420 [Pedobacter psychrotolerans]